MAHDIDTIALEAAERIMQISYQPMLGGAPQLKAKIQCEVRAALDVLAGEKLIAEGLADADSGRLLPLDQVKARHLGTTDDLLDRLQRAIDEAERKPSARNARALEQAREIRERLASDELPEGLSWDQAPEWATVLLGGKEDDAPIFRAWAESFSNGAKYCRLHDVTDVSHLDFAPGHNWALIATRPTKKAPCTDCGACVGGPHGCGKPGLHEKAEPADPADDGWIEWKGGECPVAEGTLVDAKYRDGTQRFALKALEYSGTYDAGGAHWQDDKNRLDIIAYRLHRPATPRRDATEN